MVPSETTFLYNDVVFHFCDGRVDPTQTQNHERFTIAGKAAKNHESNPTLASPECHPVPC